MLHADPLFLPAIEFHRFPDGLTFRPLDTELLVRELRDTVPLSVSRREDIDRLRSMALERFVPVR